jgi:hypothetical protein
MTKILICTVGGSHQPIVSAINDQCPDYVTFICTGKDPATGRPGSSIQITGVGNCIKARFGDDKPTLPNIPAQTGLSADRIDVCCTLSDDLDQIYLDCDNAITDVLRRFPDANIIADYTGGTKSMSAGLVMAALEHQDVTLQLVTGSRSDLIKVHDGSQYAVHAKRGVAIFAKAFMGIPAQQAAKITRPLMPSAAPAVLLHSLHTQQGVRNIVIAMTRRDFGKPAFSLRKKRSVKTHALSLLGTTRLRATS